MQCRGFSEYGRNMFGTHYPLNLCLKLEILKTFSLYTFEIWLNLSNSQVDSNLH